MCLDNKNWLNDNKNQTQPATSVSGEKKNLTCEIELNGFMLI
jgi:hypothetical protein